MVVEEHEKGIGEMSIRAKHIGVVVLVAVAVVVVYGLVVAVTIHDLPKQGLFGDMFGALSSLFTALGFGGLLLTFWQQNKEADDRERKARIETVEREKREKEERRLLLDNANAMTKSSDALTKQLGVMSKSAKLSALPHLIETMLKHIKNTHNAFIGSSDISGFGVNEIEMVMTTCERQISENNVKIIAIKQKGVVNYTANDRALLLTLEERLCGNQKALEDLMTLCKYKKDVLKLYDDV